MLMVGDPNAVARDARGYCTVPVAPVMVEEREDMFGENVLDEYVVLEGGAQEPPEEEVVAPIPAHGPVALPPEGERVRLKKEAESKEHKLTHLPKNHYCDACLRGKMKEKYSRRGAFHREMKKWGDLLTFDHLYSGSLRARGIHKEPEGFVIKDVYSGLIHVFPVPGKDGSYVTESLQFFRKREST